MTLRYFWLIALILGAVTFSGCGGGGSTSITPPPPPPATYTIGGTVSGLSGTGLVLQDNGGDDLTVASGATKFTFATKISSGGAYAVTVKTQPASPAQTCMVSTGSGTATANVTSVQVACASSFSVGGTVAGLSGTGLVLQDNGADNLTVAVNGAFTFAAGVANGAPYAVTVSTQPTNPAQTCTVTSGAGTVMANVTTVAVTCVNTTAPAWAWIDGANVAGQAGTYGTEGMAAAANVPPARGGAATWTDAAGNFWLFGGYTGQNVFNDLWKYSAGQWTWVGGANTMNQVGVYGTMGVAATGNVPGARAGSVSWVDSSGNVWIFGGYDPNNGWFNDLWKYSSGQWTWVNGSSTTNTVGVYGTEGTADAMNFPGARWEGNSWIDSSGTFWLFGGNGYDSANAFGPLNDLWKYSGGQWTWMSGSNTSGQMGTYGTLGTSAAMNVPGARDSAVSWMDASGNLWLFGGFGVDSVPATGALNDLWKYSAGAWTWMSGSKTFGQTGIYGTLGAAAVMNVPGGRWATANWIDAAGNFWIFGGDGYDSVGAGGYLSDLWRYSAGEWTWMGGAEVRNQLAVYGTLGTAAPGNLPGGRLAAASYSDASGNFWVFGGSGLDSTNTLGELNDLWEYKQ